MGQLDMVSKYVMDTSCIFDFWLIEERTTRPYHVKVRKFQEIWNHVTSLVERGVVLYPKALAKEVVFADEKLKEWIQEHNKYFVSYINYNIELGKIVNEFPAYTTKRLNKLNDAKLISIAMGRSLTVITSERYNSQTTYPTNLVIPKIPNVCEHFSIKWMNLPEFFEEEGL